MRVFGTYLLRFVICAAGCALILRLFYGRPPEGETTSQSYLGTCLVLAAIGTASSSLCLRRSRVKGWISAAIVAFVASFVLISWSGMFRPINGLPWEYFYADDYFVPFKYLAPAILAVLTAVLTFIPKQESAP